MALSPGTRIGSYEITAPLGAGGMGEVYRATDRKLDRDVAIKILPEEVAGQPERLARFEREAKVLASLNHPNIASIYGLEESDGVRCLVLELVEGQTLQDLIAAGPLPVERAMGFALQMAEALESAHENGIIHRDLKPANVMVTPEGVVKVLDFGLAKAFAEESDAAADSSMSPTLTVAATQAGIIMGTAAYMSPEQAAGQPADRRSDNWSFGVVVLEMLTGGRVFAGETVSHILASVLKDDPEWDRLPRHLPVRLRDLVRACLRKKPRRRLQAIGDARVLLEEYVGDPVSFAEESEPALAAAAPGGRVRILPWAAAALLAAGLAASLWVLWSRAPAVERITRLSIPMPGEAVPFRGYGSSVIVSPDGSRVAYVLGNDDDRQLYLHSLDRWEPTVLVPVTDNPYHPFFSPDGLWLGYVTTTELKKVPVRGGAPLTLCQLDWNRGASWGADGTIVFAPTRDSALHTVPAAGGKPTPLTVLDEDERSHRWPQVLPGGKAVLFTSIIIGQGNFDQADLELLLLETNERRVLHHGGSYGRYVETGHVVYANRGTLFAFPFDLGSLEATGSPAPVLEGVASRGNEGGAQFDVSGNGTLVYVAGDSGAQGTTIAWVNAAGEATPLWDDIQDYARPALSPDGTQMAVEVRKEGSADIWTYDLARDVAMRLTFDEGQDIFPVWSPDGDWIYYGSEQDGIRGIYRRAANGSGEPVQILQRDDRTTPTSVSPDGKTLAFNQEPRGIWLLSLDGGEPRPFQAGEAIEGDAKFSPDGRWLAYTSNESGSFQVYVRPASGEGGKWQISTDNGSFPQWSGDGRAIYYRAGDGTTMKAAIEAGGREFRAERPEKLFDGPFLRGRTGVNRFTVAPEEERFVMMELPESAEDEGVMIRVIQHWTEELYRVFSDGGGGR